VQSVGLRLEQLSIEVDFRISQISFFRKKYSTFFFFFIARTSGKTRKLVPKFDSEISKIFFFNFFRKNVKNHLFQFIFFIARMDVKTGMPLSKFDSEISKILFFYFLRKSVKIHFFQLFSTFFVYLTSAIRRLQNGATFYQS